MKVFNLGRYPHTVGDHRGPNRPILREKPCASCGEVVALRFLGEILLVIVGLSSPVALT
jgi:hypothetical protein